MQEGQDMDFQSSDIGDKATPEYFSRVEGGKKNQEKVAVKRTRTNRKVLMIILAIVLGLAAIFIVVFTIVNLSNHTTIKRTHEELPTTISEVQRRAYKRAEDTGKYYDGIVYVKDLILDMQDSNVDKDFIFETKIFLARLIYEAGDFDLSISILQHLESSSPLTDRQKYWLYHAFVDIYKSEGNIEIMEQYLEMFNRLDIDHNNMDFNLPLGGSSDEM